MDPRLTERFEGVEGAAALSSEVAALLYTVSIRSFCFIDASNRACLMSLLSSARSSMSAETGLAFIERGLFSGAFGVTGLVGISRLYNSASSAMNSLAKSSVASLVGATSVSESIRKVGKLLGAAAGRRLRVGADLGVAAVGASGTMDIISVFVDDLASSTGCGLRILLEGLVGFAATGAIGVRLLGAAGAIGAIGAAGTES